MTTSDVTLRSGRRLAARSSTIDGPLDLLDEFEPGPGGFAWLDGNHGFVGAGVAAVVSLDEAPALLAAITHHCADDTVSEQAGPRAFGALPFTGSGELVVPAVLVGRDANGRVWRTVVDDPDAPRQPNDTNDARAPSEFRVVSVTTREQWYAMVERARHDIELGNLDKVVLARAVRVIADHPFELRGVLAHLRRAQPGCVVYADRGYVGASPELLVRKRGANITARPLAGTEVDTATLVGSAKDAHEHQFVVDAVVQALRLHCSDVRAEGPTPLELAEVSHLATVVTARADTTATSIADLVGALHPTPAVAGTPRAAALDLIDELEPVTRGRYAGACGWIDRNGDGEFVVALRGGEIDGAHAVLHAGAGIVAGSEPAAEWAETQQKLMPMLQALVRP